MSGLDHLAQDARTAWAFYVYKAREEYPAISPAQATLILEELRNDEHIEAILPGTVITRRKRLRMQHHLHEIPMSVAVITMSRTFLIATNGHGVDSVDRERGRGGRLPGTPYIRCSLSPSRSKEELLVYAPGELTKDILANGAGRHILKLPLQQGVPAMPAAHQMPEDESQRDNLSQTRLLTGWQSAEDTAYFHLRGIGCANLELTMAGQDNGIDVLGTEIAAQVKMTALPVGRPVLQQLLGASVALNYRACYATAGYTSEAITFADSTGIALFTINEFAQVFATNSAAEKLERTIADTETAQLWRNAYTYRDVVLDRTSRWFTENFLEIVNHRRRWKNRRALTLSQINALDHSVSYIEGAIEALATKPDFQHGNEMIIHYHHAELLLAAGLGAQGLEYAAPPTQPLNVQTASPLTSFYQVPKL